MGDYSFGDELNAFFAADQQRAGIPEVRSPTPTDTHAPTAAEGMKHKGGQCKECGKTFKHRSSLGEHMRRHTGEMPIKCTHPGCGARFKWSSLSNHRKYHNMNTVGPDLKGPKSVPSRRRSLKPPSGCKSGPLGTDPRGPEGLRRASVNAVSDGRLENLLGQRTSLNAVSDGRLESLLGQRTSLNTTSDRSPESLDGRAAVDGGSVRDAMETVELFRQMNFDELLKDVPCFGNMDNSELSESHSDSPNLASDAVYYNLDIYGGMGRRAS